MIINSLLDTDLYKCTMQEVVWSHFPNAQVEYAFRCRTPGAWILSPYADEIREELAAYCRPAPDGGRSCASCTAFPIT